MLLSVKRSESRTKYETKRVVEELDIIELTDDEYDKINCFYKELIGHRFPALKETGQIYNVVRMILSDDLSRAEVVISVNGNLVTKPPNAPINPQQNSL
jgi:hypothetical protein